MGRGFPCRLCKPSLPRCHEKYFSACEICVFHSQWVRLGCRDRGKANPNHQSSLGGTQARALGKLAIWSENIGLEGDVLFWDLDVVVTVSLDDLFDYAPGKLCIIRNWTQSDGTGNTSIFRFRAGSEPHLLKSLEKIRSQCLFITITNKFMLHVNQRLKNPIGLRGGVQALNLTYCLSGRPTFGERPHCGRVPR